LLYIVAAPKAFAPPPPPLLKVSTYLDRRKCHTQLIQREIRKNN